MRLAHPCQFRSFGQLNGIAPEFGKHILKDFRKGLGLNASALIDELVNIYKIKLLKPDMNMKVYAFFENGERICINRSYKKHFTEYLKKMRRMSL